MILSNDVLLLLGGCVAAGIVGGYVAILHRRRQVIRENKEKIRVAARDLIFKIEMSRINSVGLVENQRLAEELGFDWFNKDEWPSDPGVIRLLVLTNRVSRVAVAIEELNQSIRRYGPDKLTESESSPLTRLTDYARRYIETADRCTKSGVISDSDFAFLYESVDRTDDDSGMLSDLGIEIMKAYMSAGVRLMMRIISGRPVSKEFE